MPKERNPIALMSLGMRFLKCVSQVRESFRYTPRYLTLVAVFIFCPLTLKTMCLVIIVCLCLNIIISVLLVFNEILLLLSHWQRCFRAWFTSFFVFLKIYYCRVDLYHLCLCIEIFLKENFETIYSVSPWFHNGLVCGVGISWFTVSNAFCKSLKTLMQIYFDLMLILFFSVMSSVWLLVVCFFWKPYWCSYSNLCFSRKL